MKLSLKAKMIVKWLLLVFLVVLMFFLCFYFYTRIANKINLEHTILSVKESNAKQIFTIQKIVLYSSASSNSKAETQKTYWNLDISQYTDIGIYIGNNSAQLGTSAENTISKLRVENIKISGANTNGALYYKNPTNFSKPVLSKEIALTQALEYEILTNQQIDYAKPQLYANATTPITISYIVDKLKENVIIKDIENPLVINGNLLKRAGIPYSSLNATISFDIIIFNTKQEHFKANVSFSIPMDSTIYDGYILKNIDKPVQSQFYKF